MSGKSKSTSNSTQTNTAYAPVKPVIDQGAGIMQDYLSNPNSTAVYQGPRVADMSGDTTAGGLDRLAWTLQPIPDAVILELGANDALRGTDPAKTRANLDQILTTLSASNIPVLLAGQP